MSGIPNAVLSEAIGEAIGGRKVVAAVMTTYTFDPGFFELEILPTLFDRTFNRIDKVRRIQLEEALEQCRVAVYYDREALVPNAQPAALDFRRIDVRRRNGCFHPKVALLLVEKPEKNGEGHAERSLIVAALSANLTRSGWWENVETGHVEEVFPEQDSRDKCSFLGDLVGLLKGVKRGCGPEEDHSALDSVLQYLRTEAPQRELVNSSSDGRHYTRIFTGQDHLADWLKDLRLHKLGFHLEILSPYLDARGATALRKLVESLAIHEVRVLLPRGRDGEPSITQEQYDDVADIATWCRLPVERTRSGPKASTEKKAPRFVHAKVMRFWARGAGEIVVVGSVNLTEAACGSSRGGNLEASFLVDVSDARHGGSWLLEPLDEDPAVFLETAEDEASEAERVGAALSLRFDWLSKNLSFRLEVPVGGKIEVSSLAGEVFGQIDGSQSGEWIEMEAAASEAVHSLLRSTSFLRARTESVEGQGEAAWRVLVREEGMGHKPSLLFELSPEEILMYWSLLTPEQREAFLEEKLVGEGAGFEGVVTGRGERYRTENTLFDRFAGLFHAFEQAGRAIRQSLEGEDVRTAEALLFGAKYDSVPVLLRRVRERLGEASEDSDEDPVQAYVTFLCAKQLADRVGADSPEFWEEFSEARVVLEEELAWLPWLRKQLPEVGQDAEFIAWYEESFLTEVADLESRAR